MEKIEKTKRITSIVIRSIWLAVELLIYFAGFTLFMDKGGFSGDQWVAAWGFWGFFCVFITIPFIFKLARDQAKQGARDGANTYTASRIGNTVTVENHPLRGAIFGFIFGVVAGVFVGPIVAPIFMIKNIIKIVKNALTLKRSV